MRQFINRVATRLGCSRCEYKKCPWALQFHHIDPAAKLFNIGNATQLVGRQKLKDEMRKCIIVCANCHAEIEHEYYTVSAQ